MSLRGWYAKATTKGRVLFEAEPMLGNLLKSLRLFHLANLSAA
jgi:hypothetical protein